MRKLAFLALSFLVSYSALSQKATLTGTLKDYKTTQTIPFANVLYGSAQGTSTDIDGNYSLTLDPGTYRIKYSSVGYDTIVKKVTLEAGETKNINVQLKEKAEIMKTVVVSAGKFEQDLSKVTVSMETLDPELVANKATTDANDIVTQVPSVHTQEGQVSIRGGAGFSYGAGSRVLLMVDGIPMLAADAGDVKWNYLPIENLESIEVIKGASSVLYGSSALNGVINIRTGFPRSEPLTKVNVIGEMYDAPFADKNSKWWDGYRGRQSFNFFHSRMIKQNFDLVVGGNFYRDQGFRMSEYSERGRLNVNTRYRDQKYKGLSYGLNANGQLGNTSTFFAWKNQDSLLTPAPNTTADSKTTRFNIDPYMEYFTAKGDKHSLKTRWFRTANNAVTDPTQSSTSDFLYSEYQFQKTIDSSFKITSGITGSYGIIRSQLFGDHDSKNLALYSQFDKTFFKGRLNTSLGIRGEYFTIDDEESKSTISVGGNKLPFQPVIRAGVNYQAFEYTFIRASYGQGYRFPTIAEKYVSTSLSAIEVFPNPQVQPESGWSAELGVKQGFKIGKGFKGFVDGSVFINQYDNMMEYTFGRYDTLTYQPSNSFNGTANGFSSRNVQSARITGFDFSIVGSGKIGPIKVTVLAGYTYMNPQALNADSAYLSTFSSLVQKDEFGQEFYDEDIDVSADTVSTNLKYRFNHLAKFDIQLDYNRWSTGLSFRYNSKIHNIDQAFVNIGNLPPSVSGGGFLGGLEQYRRENNKAVSVFDYRLSYELNEYSKVSFIINNIANKAYSTRPGLLSPPRTFVTQISFKF